MMFIGFTLRVLAQADNKLIYAAIDLGTSFSGWAYSTKSDPDKICTKIWQSHFTNHHTKKTPTCVLIRPDGKTLECFGYDAQRKYEDLILDKDHKNYYYFVDFKTKLYGKYNQPLDIKMTLQDQLGRPLPAINVFSASIKYLADDLCTQLAKRILEVKREDIQWTLTVPAIWTDQAKCVMRQSAIKAGLTSDSLIMALEPEAASVYCRKQDIRSENTESSVTLSSLKVGCKYLVVDAGGGTIDLATYEVVSSKCLKQVVASGGDISGGNTVNGEFEKFLNKALSSDKYNMFKQNYTEDWLYLMSEFEGKKKAFDPNKQNTVYMRFPLSLKEVCISSESKRKKSVLGKLKPSTYKKISLEEAVTKTEYGTGVTINGDKIRFSTQIFTSFFHNAIDGTIHLIKTQLSKVGEGEVSCILMVGGFSECTLFLLQQDVAAAFPDIPIIIPEEASTAVLKGAVLYGHDPSIISERTLKYTYGVHTAEPFIEGVHPVAKRGHTDSGSMCYDIFIKHVTRGELVKTDEPQKKMRYRPLNVKQRSILFPIYASELENPRYTTDSGCYYIGRFESELSVRRDAREQSYLVCFSFGGTELVVTAIEEKTGREQKSYFTCRL